MAKVKYVRKLFEELSAEEVLLKTGCILEKVCIYQQEEDGMVVCVKGKMHSVTGEEFDIPVLWDMEGKSYVWKINNGYNLRFEPLDLPFNGLNSE